MKHHVGIAGGRIRVSECCSEEGTNSLGSNPRMEMIFRELA